MRVFNFWLNDVAFAIGAGFLVGLIVASLGVSLLVLFWADLFVMVAAFILVGRRDVWKLIVLSIVACSLGMAYGHIFQHISRERINLPMDKKIDLSVVVVDEPQLSGKSLFLKTSAESPYRGRVTILVDQSRDIRYGDLLSLHGKVALSGHDLFMYPSRTVVLARHRGFWVREKLIDIKNSILLSFERFLSHEEAALLGGVTFGAKSNLSNDFRRDLSRSGTTHLVAVSGYNITIILFALERIFGSWLGRRRMFFIASLVVVLFVVMTGFQSSAIRAAIMGILMVFILHDGGLADTRNILVFTALGMSLVNPSVPVRDLGFQLSFLSFAGIAYLESPLRSFFHVVLDGPFHWKAVAITTFAAQCAVLPVLLIAFDFFSVTAFIANIFILGIMPITMFFGFLLVGLSFVSSYIAFGLGFIAHILLAYQIAVIKFWSVLAIPLPLSFGVWFFAPLYYGFLLWFTWKFTPPSSSRLLLS